MSSISPSRSGQPSIVVTDYVGPPIAAGFAVIPAIPDFGKKSCLQLGKEVEKKTFFEGMKGGLKLAPMAGLLIGVQMIMQEIFEKTFAERGKTSDLQSKAKSSFVVGTCSSPIVAMFNGRTMGWTAKECWGRFTPSQAIAIAIQETLFVGGISASSEVSKVMKKNLGDYSIIDYGSAFISGAAGSLLGHPANTVLTRLQNGMEVKSLFQMKISSLQGFMRGGAFKARACGIFSIGYKIGNEIFKSKE